MKFQILFAVFSLVQFSAAMTGFSLQEVEIVDPSTIMSCPDCEEIICTLTSYEPAGADEAYEKYILTADQTAAVTLNEMTGTNSFEECSSHAIASPSMTFFWDGATCALIDDSITREPETDCDYTNRKMVYTKH